MEVKRKETNYVFNQMKSEGLRNGTSTTEKMYHGDVNDTYFSSDITGSIWDLFDWVEDLRELNDYEKKKKRNKLHLRQTGIFRTYF